MFLFVCRRCIFCRDRWNKARQERCTYLITYIMWYQWAVAICEVPPNPILNLKVAVWYWFMIPCDTHMPQYIQSRHYWSNAWTIRPHLLSSGGNTACTYDKWHQGQWLWPVLLPAAIDLDRDIRYTMSQALCTRHVFYFRCLWVMLVVVTNVGEI